MRSKALSRYAWGLLGYNVLVVLWGALVRATGSGAGCGAHWPLCNGQVVPQAVMVETIIEFTHRIMSGIDLPLVLLLLVWTLRVYPRGSQARAGAWLSTLFLITEALVGAGLVLFEWVANDTSAERTIVVSVHLLNTFLLLASLALTAWWVSGGERLQLRGRGRLGWVLGLGLLGVMVIGMTGAITALADTLFPAGSLLEGMQQDLDPNSHFLVRLRFWHPAIAIGVALYLFFVMSQLGQDAKNPSVKRLTGALTGLLIVQLGAGLLNVVLLTPVWMQIVHLLLADLIWIGLVLFSAENLISPQTAAQKEEGRHPRADLSRALGS